MMIYLLYILILCIWIVSKACINFVHSFQHGFLLSLSLSLWVSGPFYLLLGTFIYFSHSSLFGIAGAFCVLRLFSLFSFLFSVFILIAMCGLSARALGQDFHSFISISYLFSVRFCNYLRFCRMLNCLCKYLTILHFAKAKAVAMGYKPSATPPPPTPYFKSA